MSDSEIEHIPWCGTLAQTLCDMSCNHQPLPAGDRAHCIVSYKHYGFESQYWYELEYTNKCTYLERTILRTLMSLKVKLLLTLEAS